MKLLTQIANMYCTDKGTTQPPCHGFSEIYDDYLVAKRDETAKVLEIGIDRGGSLRMWRDYFPNAFIHGIDVQTWQFFEEDRIKTHFANQSSKTELEHVISKTGTNIDLIVDDGSHDVIYQQISFGVLFKHLKKGGIYIIEDLHTSFLDEWLKNHNFDSDYDYTAYNVVSKFKSTGKLQTPYISEEDKKYIEDNVQKIELYDINEDKNHITSVIVKK